MGWSQSNPCVEAQSFRIVVLGSSTAAGAGVSVSDSAWVNRYRAFLQEINPNNEVINLAQGGYNTYKIMPDGFIPPVNRPNPDTNKNITEALSLNPDAIIVNLPSNDNSQGFTVAEQLSNLDSVFNLSNQNNVPIWICTTQPVNYSDPAKRQIQEDIKDSIHLMFSPYSIDFWTTIALPDNSIDSIYNADGVHLNDAGHAILFQRVVQTNIPGQIYVPNTITDYWAKEIHFDLASKCGDSATQFQVEVANLSPQDMSPTSIKLVLSNLTTGAISTDSILVNSISICSYDTLSFLMPTNVAGSYRVEGIVSNPNDTHSINDTIILEFESIGYPNQLVLDDTLCDPSNAIFSVTETDMDSTSWFENALDTAPVFAGAQFQTPVVDSTQTWYFETIRGNLFYSNSLKTRDSHSINWNGTMFDLVADTDMIVDSLDVKITTLGLQTVNIYTKTGSHVGFQMDSTVWNLLGTQTVNVTAVDDFTAVDLGAFVMNAGDTVGIYIELENPSSRLGYQWQSNPTTRANNELTVITGSGVSHDFSAVFYPRDWAGQVFYHFGYRPDGECKTDRIPVTAFVSQTQVNLGPDTIIDTQDSIQISGPTGMLSYNWNDGSMDSSLLVIAADLGKGIHYIILNATDSLKCVKSDTVIVGVADLVTVSEIQNKTLDFYPNPAQDVVYVDGIVSENVSYQIYNLKGQMIRSGMMGQNGRIELSGISSGVYVLQLEGRFGKLVVE